MVQLRGRISATMALVLMLSACSDNTAFNTGPDEPFKGRSCFDFTDHLHSVSLIETPGWALAVAFEDGLAYVADGNNGLQIIEYTTPSSPVLRGAVGASDPALDVDAENGVVCLTLGAGGIAVIDVGDPDRPLVVGRLATPGGAQGVSIRDTVAYVADDIIGLMSISIADRDAPYTLGVENSPGRAVDVAVSGAFAYVADRQNGLRVVNVNNPSEPWLVNTIALPYGGRGVACAGDLAFVAGDGAGLQIVDVSTPGAESVIGSLATGGVASNVAVDSRGEVAFVVKGRNGVEVVDVADPSAPVAVNFLATSAEASGVATVNGFTLIGESTGGVHAVNSVTPLPPPVTARMSGTDAREVNLVASREGRAYGAGPAIGLFVVEPSDSVLQPLGTLTLDYEATDLVVPGDTVYVAAESGGIQMLDVADASGPAAAGWVPHQGIVTALDWARGVLYFAGGRTFGTCITGDDVVNTIDLRSSTASAVKVEGDYAYVGKNTNSIQAVNIEFPDRPALIVPLTIAGACVDILARSGYLFVLTSASNGVEVYDVRNPLSSMSVAFVNLSARPLAGALDGSVLYLAAGTGGTAVIDVSDPAFPLRIGSIPSRNSSRGATVAGGAVFVADGTGGLFTVPAQGCVPSR